MHRSLARRLLVLLVPLAIAVLLAGLPAQRAAAQAPDPVTISVQTLLQVLGYDPGPADGLAGAKTVEAITAFQRSDGGTVDGKPSEALLARLRAAVASPRKQPGTPAPPAVAEQPFDDAEAQLRIRQAASTAAAASAKVEELRKAIDVERNRTLQTNEERDLSRETISGLEKSLREAEASQRDRAAALKEAQDARSRGLAGETERRKLEAARRPPPPPAPVTPPVAKPAPPPPPPASLPAERWARGDLTMLKGCWQLGREAPFSLRKADQTIEACTTQTGAVCFGETGTGERSQTTKCPSGPLFSCKAAITARFEGGMLLTRQPEVKCTGGLTWFGDYNALTCRRVNDSLAICTDGVKHELEMRRR